MALRKASAYSKKKVRPYTRKSNVKSRSYIKTIPQQRIVKFKMGAAEDYRKGKFKFILKLVAGEKVLIRDNALEASRQYIHKKLEKSFPGQYFFEVKVYPHHILRENKMLTGAGADRMQTGMAHSFGTTVGRAAIVKKDQEVFFVATLNEKVMRGAIKVLEKVKAKLPCHARIEITKKE